MPQLAQTQRQRKWSTKVRSGCNTCKVRKKKCDETKPCCLRCIKGRYSCDGYSPPKAWLFNTAKETPDFKRDRSSGQPLQLLSSLHGDTRQPLTIEQPISDEADVVASSDVTPSFLLEPSSPLSSDSDRSYAQYYLYKVVPLLSTTKSWHSFWSATVPQASWQNQSIHHAMIALTIAYKYSTSGTERSDEIMRRTNLAIRAFTDQRASPDLALIMCRLFSSIAQCLGDWKTAIIHICSGGRILKEAARRGPTNSAIEKLMAPTFLCATENAISDPNTLVRVPPSKQLSFADLKTIHSDYRNLLQFLKLQGYWKKIGSPIRSFFLISGSIMTQSICSVMYPDVLTFTKHDPIVPAEQIKDDLLEAEALLSLSELKAAYQQLFYDLISNPRLCDDNTVFCSNIKLQLKRCVENFVVQAAEIEPRMTAGTCWNESHEGRCSIEEHLQHPSVGMDQKHMRILRSRSSSISHAEDSLDENLREQTAYYLEYVCPYRSGLLLAQVP